MRGCARFSYPWTPAWARSILLGTVLVFAPGNVAWPQQGSEVVPTSTAVPTSTPVPPTATPCVDQTRPVTVGGTKKCPAGTVQVVLNGETRCVQSCADPKQTRVGINCANLCSPCSAECVTCAYQTINFDAGTNFNSGQKLDDSDVLTLEAGSLSCLTTKINAAIKDVTTTGEYRDDEIFLRFLNSFPGLMADIRTFPNKTYQKSDFCVTSAWQLATFNSPHKFLTSSNQLQPGGLNPGSDCFAVVHDTNGGQKSLKGQRCANIRLDAGQTCSEISNSKRHYEGMVVKGSFTVDENCNLLRIGDTIPEKQCLSDLSAVLRIKASSPISLLWDGASELHHFPSLVHFPLDLAGADKWYAWYASDTTPLLVYDPNHQGSITSAQQLFGNWTFGGKRGAHQKTTAGGPTAQPWKDGYEALAALDQNGDQQISGVELQPLGLWFDSNRDGVSQTGEVRSLVSMDVQRLHLGPTSTEPLTRNILVKVGFERLKDDALVPGATVDWYSQGSDSLSALVSRQETMSQILSGGKASELAHSPSVSDLPIAHGKVTSNSIVTGQWIWSGDGDITGQGQGILALAEVDDRGLQGISLSNTPVESRQVPIRGVINFTALNGKITSQDSKKVALRFDSVAMVGDRKGAKPSLETEATIDLATGIMSGVTTQRFVTDSDQRTVTYRWKAHRQR